MFGPINLSLLIELGQVTQVGVVHSYLVLVTQLSSLLQPVPVQLLLSLQVVQLCPGLRPV